MRLIYAITLVCLGTLACGDSPTGPSGSAGTLTVMLKDTPFSDARAVLVTFSEVTAHRSTEADFTRVPFAGSATSRTCDLKKLQTAQDVLGTGPLAAGQYTQIRLVVSSAALYFENESTGGPCAATVTASGRSAPLEIPSGEVKLNRQFEVSASGATTMLLDFDGDRSIRETGNNRFMMTPVITVVSVQ